MNVSKLTFQKGTLSQNGTVGKILMWMQDNEKFCRNTNVSTLANMLGETCGTSFNNIKAQLLKMVNTQMVYRQNGKRRATFVINYYHKDIPGYILDRAPESVQTRVKAMKRAIEEDAEHKSIDENGCVVTKMARKKEEEKGPEPEPEKEPEQEPKEEPVAEPVEKPVEPKEEKQTTHSVVVPVEVNHNDNGMNISITLNLNLR